PTYWGAGNLIAYASDRATNGQNLDVWIQQLSGGEARRLTTHAADDHEPSFSPDGGMIAFRSERDGGGIYLIPTIGGAERKVADAGHDPRFSPDGKWISFWKGDPAPYGQFTSVNRGGSIWVAAVAGGSPRRLAPDFYASRPVWSPDSKMILFTGWSTNAASDWYVAGPGGDDAPRKTGLLRLLNTRKFVPRLTYVTWTPAGLIFTGQIGDSVNTWKVAIDPAKLEVTGEPERITSGSGIESHPNMAGNTLVYANSLNNEDIWYLPVDHAAGRAKGDPVRLTNSTASDVSSSVSHDGTRIAFGSIMAGNITVMVHDLVTGNRMRLMSVEASGVPGLNISPDGNQVGWQTARPDRKLESHVAALDGTSRRVCEDCQFRSWDGEKPSQILFGRRGASYLLNPATGTEAKVMEATGSGIHLSWDARWAIFYILDGSVSHIYLCPVRPDRVATKADYIEVSDAKAMDILPELSPDMNIAYFLSNRDGFQCMWARRLDPATKRPSGEPFAVQHFHSAKLSPAYVPGGRRRMDTARDKIVFTMAERSGNIWRADLPAAASTR
ncbi:MAG: hypothetical protein FJW39_34375, partial [Acidobacteria bacterium]|nr:hypothetical protein [Acidobacteriota bacterium]